VHRQQALSMIHREREHQERRWVPEHDACYTPSDWSLLLAKHIGRLSDTVLEEGGGDAYRRRLAVIGALAVAALEVS
jgi:hypothetical protein